MRTELFFTPEIEILRISTLKRLEIVLNSYENVDIQ